MKLLLMISAAFLLLILIAGAPMYAQEPKDQHDQQEEKQAKPEEKKAEQEKSAKPEEKQAQEEKHAKPEKQAQHEEQHEQPVQRADNRNHGRIPDDRFRANFGREHVFIINRPVIVEGAPRFRYGGYWFGFGQPWPQEWAYSDNVYLDFVDGGYYLYNPVHPGIRIVINVI